METATAEEFLKRTDCVCITTPPPQSRLLSTAQKRRNHKFSALQRFILAISVWMIFMQTHRISIVSALPQRNHISAEYLGYSESSENTWNLLDGMSRLQNANEGLKEETAAVHNNRDEHLGHRQHKRNDNKAGDEKPEWQNICGGESEGGAWSDSNEIEDNHNKRDYLQMYMKNLRKSVYAEYRALKSSGFDDIDIDDMKAWRRHERKYKFLPTLEHNAPISPTCWHQSMQIFIASFAYLHKMQQQLDHQNLHTESGISRELHALQQSAQRMLCEIETNIRGTHPADKRRQLHVYTRDEMAATINFYTESVLTSTRAIVGSTRSVNHTDLRFAKFFYQNYLLSILHLLPRQHSSNALQLEYACV